MAFRLLFSNVKRVSHFVVDRTFPPRLLHFIVSFLLICCFNVVIYIIFGDFRLRGRVFDAENGDLGPFKAGSRRSLPEASSAVIYLPKVGDQASYLPRPAVVSRVLLPNACIGVLSVVSRVLLPNACIGVLSLPKACNQVVRLPKPSTAVRDNLLTSRSKRYSNSSDDGFYEVVVEEGQLIFKIDEMAYYVQRALMYCPKCHRTFNNVEEYNAHFATYKCSQGKEHGKGKHRCNWCGGYFANKEKKVPKKHRCSYQVLLYKDELSEGIPKISTELKGKDAELKVLQFAKRIYQSRMKLIEYVDREGYDSILKDKESTKFFSVRVKIVHVPSSISEDKHVDNSSVY